ncbi:MAG: right-handed parallel beta-helix repeat-containing protein [Clostridia bacterium]|nr:right-handed parallel beta-helix repeat-containing protein [Clostridia bacterium]
MTQLHNRFPNRVYTITDFGARCCDRPQTAEIQAALDRCFLDGGGRVVIPAGIFLTGGLRLRSNTVLYLEAGAILKGSRDSEDYTGYIHDEIEPINEPDDGTVGRSVYPFSRWNNAIIRVIDAKNVAIVGERGSYIDGSNCFDVQGEEEYRGPHAINIQRSEDILLEGYTIVDSGNWAHAIFITNHIVARELTVYGGHDGFDVRTCDDVLIEGCQFYTGDDCIAGFDNCDVVIRDCILNSSCSALRFGGNHVLVEGCHAYAPGLYGFRGNLSPEKKMAGAVTDESCRHNMHNVFLYYCDNRAVIRKTPGDILIRHCTFENADTLFRLPWGHKWCCNRSLATIRFEDCRVSGLCEPITIDGCAEEPLTLELENVEIGAREGFEDVAVIDTCHHERIALHGVTLKGYHAPTLLAKTQGQIDICNSTDIIIKEG